MNYRGPDWLFKHRSRFPLSTIILHLDSGYKLDLLIENTVIVELKCVETLLPIHKAQLLTYLRLANKPLGLLLNFNVVHLREGIKRVLNNKYQMGIAATQR